MEITAAERDEFVAMLNDRRMVLALECGHHGGRHGGGPGKIPQEARRPTIWEIDVLGMFIMVMLGPQIYRP